MACKHACYSPTHFYPSYFAWKHECVVKDYTQSQKWTGVIIVHFALISGGKT